jgi:hypothetical protein
MIKSVFTKEGSHADARLLSPVAFVWALFLVTAHGLAQSTTAPTLTPFQQSLVNSRSLAPNGTFPLIVPTIDPFYAGSYSAVDLGLVPTRIVADIGALTFKDANTLLVDVNTYQATAEIDAVTVTRGTGGHITGFSGTGTLFANAPYIDGGLQYGPGGVLFYTAFGPNQLVQFKPGSTSPDLYTDLTPLGVAYSVGSLAFVPPGFGGAGQLKLISWNAETWYNTYLSPNGLGTFTVGPTSSPATPLPPVNWEGIAFVAAGQPLFAANSVLINADLSNAVYSFTVDTSGNPITSTEKHFMDVGDPVGMTVDPMTGDILITTEQGPTAGHITLVKGFSPTTPPPAPTATTSKGTYNPGEAIVVNFSNASGSAKDWIGLYAVGAPNTGYLQWSYTDGTQVGTAGITSGTVTFPSGLPSVGNYEARLFFSGDYAIQADAPFAVQNGPPGQASNPNPAANATAVGLSPTLSWMAGAGATSHTVYFGTNPTPGAAELKGSQGGTSYSPGALTGLTTYYWRIDEVNTLGTTPGVVWSFTTGNASTLPAVTTSKATYIPGEAIVVNFSNASGSAGDWIGLYVAGSPNTVYLQWFYTDGTQVGTAGITSGSVTFPSGLPNVGSYEARLFFNGSYTLRASVAFAVQNGPPGQASNPNPAANATGVVLSPTLSWTAGAGATSHTVYFGTNPTPGAAELKGSQAGTSYSPGALTGLTTYYWRIDEVNAQGTTTGLVWSFTTGNPATLPTVTTSKGTYLPGQAIGVNFSNASGSAHDWIGLFAAGTANTAYLQWFYTDGTQVGTAGITSGSVNFPSGLPNVGSYEARLFFNSSYTLQASVAFAVQSAPPGQATSPNPAANATGVALSPTLSWTAGAGATSHTVYFGTNPTPGAAELKGSQAGTSYSPGTLKGHTTYYWRIDEVNAQGTTTGVVWSFTTG